MDRTINCEQRQKGRNFFEWLDISQPKRKIGDSDNDKDEGETNEKETQNDEADISSDTGMIELTSVFQNYSGLEAYATKSVTNNKRTKVIVRFQDHTELNLTNMKLKNNKNAKEGNKIVEKESVTRQLLGNGPENCTQMLHMKSTNV